MLEFTGERIVPESGQCEPSFALKMYQEHVARYLFAAQVAGGRKVLDIGCGVGYGAQLLARSGAESVTAIDVSEAAIEHASRFYPHRVLQYSVQSAEQFSFTGKFDVVTCFELIEHVDQPHLVLQQIAAAIAENGILFLSTPRKKGSQRSAFHKHEMALHEFSGLVECYFPHTRFYFENNHFASLVTANAPESLNRIYSIHSQFDIGQADYFVAVASSAPVPELREQLVLNSDSYVTNLEHDVKVLHNAEDQCTAEKQRLAAENEALRLQAQTDAQARAVETRGLAEHEKEISLLREQFALGTRDMQEAGARAGAEAERALVELRAELQRETSENAELRRTGEVWRVQSEQAAAQTMQSRLESDAAQQRVRQMTMEKARLETRISELERAFQESEVQRSSAIQEISLLRERQRESALHAANLQKQVVDLRASLSWRITKPARQLLDACYGMKRLVYSSKPVTFENTRVSHAPHAVEAAAAVTSGRAVGAAAAQPVHELFEGRKHFDVVYAIGCHEGESKRYRVHNLFESLRQLGYTVTAILDSDLASLMEAGITCHVLVFFRCAWDERIEAAIQYCRAKKIPTAFDIDDLVFDPGRVELVRVLSTFSEAGRQEYLDGVRRYRRTLLSCDYATCTTSYLAGILRETGKTAHVIPNSLNLRQIELARSLQLERRSETVRIGYFSGSNTHQVDFHECEEALLQVMDGHPEVRFVVMGHLELGPAWDVFPGRIERRAFLPYTEMLEVLAGVDINIAPLERGNAYCESKSQLKIFEAGLVGVPTVASEVSGYAEAIDSGQDGVLARSQEEWRSALTTLVSSAEARSGMGQRAHERALRQFGPAVVGRKAAQVYGLEPKTALLAREQHASSPPLRISWIIPGLIIGGGGHRNILRAAYHLSRFGHDVELYFTSTDLTEAKLQATVAEHFYPLHCPMFRYTGSLRPADVIVATHWSTVDAAVRNRAAARELVYFVQDFEPAFAPMGTEYILAENTYRLGLYHITSGPWCENFLRNQFHVPADHFLFPVDTDVYRPGTRTSVEKNVVFFAKPEMPRRCFELGVMALEELHRLKPRLKITLFGSPHVKASEIPFPCDVRGILPTVHDLAAMYVNADVGVVFSTTNPSLIPYEMMACGLPVVDLGRPGNELNYGGRDDIALLADPRPSMMARQVAELLDNSEELSKRARNGLDFVSIFPSEEQMARRVEQLIVERLNRQTKQVRAEVPQCARV